MKINQSECSIRRFISIQVPRNKQEKTNKSEMLTRPDPPKSGKIVTRPDPTRGSIRPVDNSGRYTEIESLFIDSPERRPN